MDDAQLTAEGWTKLPTRSFSAAIGSTWIRGEPGARTVGLPTGPEVINDHMRSVHGGALMTFADISLGLAVADLIGEPRLSTVQLQYNFAGAVAAGSFLTCEPEIVRRTSKLAFARGLFKADGEVVGSAEGIFRIFD